MACIFFAIRLAAPSLPPSAAEWTAPAPAPSTPSACCFCTARSAAYLVAAIPNPAIPSRAACGGKRWSDDAAAAAVDDAMRLNVVAAPFPRTARLKAAQDAAAPFSVRVACDMRSCRARRAASGPAPAPGPPRTSPWTYRSTRSSAQPRSSRASLPSTPEPFAAERAAAAVAVPVASAVAAVWMAPSSCSRR